MASPVGSGKGILGGLSSIACLWWGSPSLMIKSLKRLRHYRSFALSASI